MENNKREYLIKEIEKVDLNAKNEISKIKKASRIHRLAGFATQVVGLVNISFIVDNLFNGSNASSIFFALAAVTSFAISGTQFKKCSNCDNTLNNIVEEYSKKYCIKNPYN